MSKYYSGVDGSLEYKGKAVSKVRDWQIQVQADALETSVLSERDREYTTGMRSATGSATVLYYGDAPVKVIEQVLQRNADVSDTCRLKLVWDKKSFEFDAVITTAQTGMSVGEVMSVAIQFQKTGAFIADGTVL